MSEQDDLSQDEQENFAQTTQLQDYYALSLKDRQSVQRIHSRFLLHQRSQMQAHAQTEGRSAGQFIQFSRQRRKQNGLWSFVALAAALLIVSISGILIVSAHNSFDLALQATPTVPTVAASQISIESVNMTSATSGWGVEISTQGQPQFLIRTTDGGKNWQEFHSIQQDSGMGDDFFLNDTTAWVLPDTGKQLKNTTPLLSTHDGGLHWQTSSIPLTEPAMTFVDAQHGWAWSGMRPAATGFLLQTIDGGKTWTKMMPLLKMTQKNGASPPQLLSKPQLLSTFLQTRTVFSFNFVTPEIGWFLSNPMNGQKLSNNQELYKTSDGGKSWTVQTPDIFELTLPTQEFPIAPNAATSLTMPKFTDIQHGLIGTSTPAAINGLQLITICSTANGGQSWKLSKLTISPNTGLTATQSITIIDATHIAIVEKGDMRIYSLINQGWIVSGNSHWSGFPGDVKFINSRIGWLDALQTSAKNGKITHALYETHDGGNTWQKTIQLAG